MTRPEIPMISKTLTFLLAVGLLTGSLTAATVNYKYDDTGRLISAAYDNGTGVFYSYDKAGNLLGLSVPAGTPKITDSGVVNAASYGTPLVRGEIAAIFGTNLSSGTLVATSVPLPTLLAGTQVTVGGVPAPLFYVSPTQIDFQVPFEAPLNGNASVVVIQNGTPSPVQAVTTTEYAPAVFTYYRTVTALDPIIVHADNTLVTPSSPASAGETLVMYATGAGSFDNPPATGAVGPSAPVANTTVRATVTVSGIPVSVPFSGLTPQLVGVLQINFTLPSPLAPRATVPVSVSFGGGAASVPVNLYVH